ncbi:MAG: lipolytic enzyme family, partial [Proteobacteria bacterium]|nr:lipolytic enzyme family [Pseudomonadota bacterium]
SRGIDVVLVGVPKFGIMLSPPEFYENLAKELDLPYEGDVIRTVLMNSDQKSDEVHPNAKGYRVMAEALAELLRKSGAI